MIPQLLLFCFPCFTQNSISLFKAYPSDYQIDIAPQWAQLMYSKNPSVNEVVDAYNRYFETYAFEKTIHTQNYKHWIKRVENLLDENAKIVLPNKEQEKKHYDFLKNKRSTLNKSMDVWSSIGPFETYKNGQNQTVSLQANVYSIDQSSNNSDLLICGTEAGGVYKTIDKGLSWALISKNEVFCNGITAVAIDPSNDDIFYAAGNNRLYKSTDGGLIWTENYYVGSSSYEIKFDPSNTDHIFLVSGNGLYESIDSGSSWSQLFSEQCWDLDFHPNNSNIIYLLKSNDALKKSELYRSTNNGINWTLISSGWYVPEVPAQAVENGGKIAVSPDSPNRVYACLIGTSKLGDNGWIGIYRSDDSGLNWYLPSGQIGGPYNPINTMPWNAAAYSSGYHQGFYNFDMEVSPSDADLIWFGTVRLSESSDGGYNYTSIGAANSTRLTDIHADIQSIHLSGSDIWIASDGGINFSNDNLQSHESRKYGITALDFWGFGSGWNDDVLVGGKYHNGNTVQYENYGAGNSHNVGGVEEATGYVNPLTNKTTYFNQYWTGYTVSKKIAEQIGGSTTNLNPVNLIPNESYTTSYSSGLYHHPNYADHMIAGKDSIIWKSYDGGNTWDVMHDFGQGRVLEIEYCRSNPEVIYAVFQPIGGYWDWCKVYKTIDGGSSWTALTDIPSNNRWRLEITTNPLDENEIWVATVNGGNGQKIYKSDNGGVSWTNRTSSVFDNDKIRDIVYHGGSDELVYAITEASFYYYQKSSNTWVQYDSGLPVVQNVKYLKLFYPTSKIRMASGGRGFWEADMPMSFDPQTIPMTTRDTLDCQRDSVQFDSYSIVEHNGTNWLWTITPAPQFISDPALRNPLVVFGSPGSYDVTLSVTDSDSNNDTKTINSMVYVQSNCSPDTLQGMAMKTTASGDWVQLPNLGITTNNFTVSAWIKPAGIQEDYASIIMNDGDAAGLNFREGNNTLGYHWLNGGQWWWDSNLEVPQDEWSYVTLVVDPNGISIYLNGVQSRHNIAISPLDITSMKVGSYKAWNSRNYFGEIDEVCLWNRSLTEDEIRTLRHLTKEDVTTDPNFIAYYQFNQDQSEVLDKVGLNHGTMIGGASFQDCYAPFGGGSSALLDVNASGTYSFGNTGIELIFPGIGTLPNGKIVANRINILPVPELNNSESLGSYMIINNYGNQNFTDAFDLKFDDPYSSPSLIAQTTPSSVKLVRRNTNSESFDWTRLCSMPNLMGEYYFFPGNQACAIPQMGQYFIFNCKPNSIITMDVLDGEVLDERVTDFIEAYNSIFTGADVRYSSEGQIDLLEGFEIHSGALFEALNANCLED